MDLETGLDAKKLKMTAPAAKESYHVTYSKVILKSFIMLYSNKRFRQLKERSKPS